MGATSTTCESYSWWYLSYLPAPKLRIRTYLRGLSGTSQIVNWVGFEHAGKCQQKVLLQLNLAINLIVQHYQSRQHMQVNVLRCEPFHLRVIIYQSLNACSPQARLQNQTQVHPSTHTVCVTGFGWLDIQQLKELTVAHTFRLTFTTTGMFLLSNSLPWCLHCRRQSNVRVQVRNPKRRFSMSPNHVKAEV